MIGEARDSERMIVGSTGQASAFAQAPLCYPGSSKHTQAVVNQRKRRRFMLYYMLLTSAFVFVVGHWNAITNPYVIHDDVRQVIYWMQRWHDPELFQNDFLTQYAANYVTWGVEAIYAVGSLFMNPVQFSKVVAGILWLVTAGFLFGLGLQFRNEVSGIFMVFTSFFFTGFIMQISGGIPKGFAYPLLAGYLFFLARGNLLAAGFVILLASVLIPYAFLLCVVTHALYLLWDYRGALVRSTRRSGLGLPEETHGRRPQDGGPRSSSCTASGTLGSAKAMTVGKLLLVNLPVLAGVLLIALKYVVFASPQMGSLLSWPEMVGKPEYGPLGRVEIVPSPSFLVELVRPWIKVSPFHDAGLGWGLSCMIACIALSVVAWRKRGTIIDLSVFPVFGCFLAASLVLYVLSRGLLVKLFLPDRYLEYSLTIFYCAALTASFTVIFVRAGHSRAFVCALLIVFTLLAAVRTHNLGIYDYSKDAALYRFLETTSKNTLIAGHPEVMDNIPTFACRKAFVTYELSHTWLDRYWSIVKKRTHDFFEAYYAEDPEEIRRFCRYYGVNYLVVRDRDFAQEQIRQGRIYFEPFGAFVRELAAHRTRFAALDEAAFPIVFQADGIRVLSVQDRTKLSQP